MAINTETRKQVDFFIGTEIEHTIMKGEKTLFVVDTKPTDQIEDLLIKHDINHIYFGTSQSFHPQNLYEWASWDEMIKYFLVKDYWVTLDFGVEYANGITEYSWVEFDNFIPMISVKIPNIKLFNYNATVKIDDITWGDTNPGVWCHPLNELLTRKAFTSWKDYKGDTPIEDEQ